jgi:hypothetical protein
MTAGQPLSAIRMTQETTNPDDFVLWPITDLIDEDDVERPHARIGRRLFPDSQQGDEDVPLHREAAGSAQ